MNLDDLDAQSQVPSRPNRFVPRSSKAKPKPKSEPVAKQEPVPKPDPEKPELKPTRVELDALTVKKKDEEESAPKAEDSNGGLKTENDDVSKEDDPMGEDEPEDEVVREINVFFNPKIVDNSKLYVLQYPLRPWWRPYELESRCEEVRLSPTTSEMEIDWSLDRDLKNFDEDCASRLKMTKQTLSTTWKSPGTSGYAVGVLMGNKLHLNPVHAVVQLRPSLDHLNSSGSKRKNSVKGMQKLQLSWKTLDKKNLWVHQRCRFSLSFCYFVTELWLFSEELLENKRMESSTEKKTEDEESWLPLRYHSSKSDFSARYLRKMVVQESSPIELTMSPHDYVDSLCPKTCKGSSRRSLLSVPLEERIKKLIVEEPVVRWFGDLKKYFAPDHTTEELLDVLQKHSQLLLSSGLWVPKTLLLYPNKDEKGLDINHIANKDHKDRQTARSYVLNLSRKNPVIRNSHLDLQEGIKIHVYDSLRILAVSRPSTQDLKFKEQPDMSFMELYPDIVKTQEQNWERMEEKLRIAVKSNTDRYLKCASMTTTPGKSLNSGKGTTKGASEVHIGGRTMSDETRAALQEAIKEVFQDHKARQLELQRVISEITIDIHGSYVLKSSPDHPEHDKLRKVIIDLLCAKGPNAKLKRGEVSEATKISLGQEFTSNEFSKVINEFCVSSGSSWVLKKGHGGNRFWKPDETD
ncbi:DNA-directed RNA polymerase III subunit RPC5-like [Pyrus x bretschneideri]|uniref:DNA-directed RNA polymerase III subunit RPC5-like n=1 Tax=Pyrus x bretschneideri TaxID=225117 RepID=UPI0020309776|nr:DNA-directed RNA polymerase III subunit RPC5-like [Pyrus x bretschneideri]